MDVTPHLIAICEDQLKVLGRSRGSSYVRRQISHWRQHYGHNVAERVSTALHGRYDAIPQPEHPIQPIRHPRPQRRYAA